MKTIFSAFIITLGSFGLAMAGEPQPPALSGIPANGPSSGLESTAPVSGTTLTLSAGTQITRSFKGGTVLIHENSRPVFARDSKDWPVIIAGSLALVFQQDNGGGQLIAIGDDGAIAEIGEGYLLDPSGRSVLPLDLAVAYDPLSGTVVVTLGDQLKSFQYAPVHSSVEVTVSAGTNTDWVLDNLEMRVIKGEKTDGKSTPTNAATSGLSQANDSKVTAALNSSLLDQQWGSGILARSLVQMPPRPYPRSVSKLEIFTPPSIRNLSADAIRMLLKKNQEK